MSKTKTVTESKKQLEPGKSEPPDGGWRETVESIAMAVILALLFRGFVAEAFVIPTGSMAPTLVGRHKDLKCPKCGTWYQVSCSPEADNEVLTGMHVVNGTCSVCRYTQRLNPRENPNEASFSGDRIIVGKFCYDFEEPERWDVIVFKFPGNAAVNYIKRLVGLPGEYLEIAGGNIYTRQKGDAEDKLLIARKPPPKLDALLQIVDDTDHIPPDLTKLGWPSRWQNWPPAEKNQSGQWEVLDGGRAFAVRPAGEAEAWIRYRHLVPSYEDWKLVDEHHQLPQDIAQRRGELIADYYAYNTAAREQAVGSRVVPMWRFPLTQGYRPPADIPPGPQLGEEPPPGAFGEHWVDDLAVDCTADVMSKSGELTLMLVRGGVKHLCRIDLANGQATMSMVDPGGESLIFSGDDGHKIAQVKAQTSVTGPGKYRLRLSNCDHEMLLWVNGAVVKFEGPTQYDSVDLVTPYSSDKEPGDLAPAGIGTHGADVRLSRLRILRDKYYIATMGGDGNNDYIFNPGADRIRDIFRDPSQWIAPRGLFAENNRRSVGFQLEDDQFLPLGDNSPQSSDGRYWYARDRDGRWDEHHYVERDLLIGKALLIYWPHTWNTPIPFLPKFSRMGPIR
ncbi:MAG TPA: signal peptidase I [Pirellulaceae bacterium]|jgi:signal peptidase I